MDKTVYLETLGCQMNIVDSERIIALLSQIGYRQVDAYENADLVLLNTCSIRDRAERKVYGHLGRFKPLKEKKPGLIVGVGGCVAQQEGEKLLAKIPHLDIVFGTHNIHKLPEMVLKVEAREGRFQETEFLERRLALACFRAEVKVNPSPGLSPSCRGVIISAPTALYRMFEVGRSVVPVAISSMK